MMGGIMLLELEALTFPQAAIGIGLFLLGLLGIRQSRIVYTEPIPRFVIDYHGWSSTILSLPYIAGFFLSMGVGAFEPVLRSRHELGRPGLVTMHHDLLAWYFLLVSPISSSPLVSPSRKGRCPTQRPQGHGRLQSPPPRTTTRSSPTRKPTVRR